MDTIRVDMENLTEEERAQLLKLIEKSNKPKSKVWKPEQGEIYCYIDAFDGIMPCPKADLNSSFDIIDERRYSIGNCFKTEEEAKFMVEKLKVIAELKRFAEENNERKIEWPSDFARENVAIFYNYIKDEIDTYGWSNSQYEIVYFSSHKIAQRAIEAIGADRLKKYYFGIEE